MRDLNRLLRNAVTVSLFLLLWAGIATTVAAQGPMTIQATANVENWSMWTAKVSINSF